MQNLSLQTTQNSSVKKMTDSTNKANVSADNVASTENNSPFQQMLNKQVQAQQAPAKQVEAKAEVKQETPAENAIPANSTTVAIEAKPKVSTHVVSTANVKKPSDKKLNIDADVTGKLVENQSSASLIVSESINTKGSLKADADNPANDVVVSKSDAVANGLAPVVNIMPLVNAQAAPILAAQADKVDSTTQAQRSLDVIFGNALQQSKVANIPDVVSQDAQATSDTNNWLDAMLPDAAKPSLGDESANTKLVLNAIKEGAAKELAGKDAVVKDTVAKEMAMPASFQPAAQVNAGATTQQVGSTNNISAYPGKTGWDQAISQKVVWMVGAGEQSATLTLNPPDLGPLQVVIQVRNDQADTTFISDNAEVRQALQDGMANLRDKMSESGLQLGQANVSSGEQSQQQFQQTAQQRLSVAQRNTSNTIPSAEKNGTVNNIVRVSNGLVDTFA